MDEETIKRVVLEYMHSQTGYGPELRPRCEFEDLYINSIVPQEDGTITVEFRYDFDEDGFSQYDKNVIFKGNLRINIDESIQEIFLYLIHCGVAAHGPPSKREFEFRKGLF